MTQQNDNSYPFRSLLQRDKSRGILASISRVSYVRKSRIVEANRSRELEIDNCSLKMIAFSRGICRYGAPKDNATESAVCQLESNGANDNTTVRLGRPTRSPSYDTKNTVYNTLTIRNV